MMLSSDVKNIVLNYLSSKGEIQSLLTEKELLSYEYLDKKLIDSMDIVEMIIKFEELFKIHFEPFHLQSVDFRTIGGLISLIEKLMQEKENSIEGAR